MGQIVEHAPQKFGRDHPLGAGMQFGKGPFAGAVNGHEEALLAFFGPHFREIEVLVADGIVLAFLFRGALPVFAQRPATDAVALKAAVERGAGQRCIIVACSAYRQSSGAKRVCRRKATTMASCPVLSTVDTGAGPMRASRTPGRLRHLATVFGLMR